MQNLSPHFLYWPKCFFFLPLHYRVSSVPTPPVCNTDPADCSDDDDDDPDRYRAQFTRTTRGRDQLIFCGQPFVYEKLAIMANGEPKKLWRCNQWWNKRCRARVYTIGETVTPLNKYHTHQEIIKRKKRVSRKMAAVVADGQETIKKEIVIVSSEN